MPLAKSGKYFSNPARMRQADSMAPQDGDVPDVDGNQADDDSGQSVTITKKPDGSFSTEQGGDVVDHPDMASAIEALGGAFKQQEDPDDGADDSLAVDSQASDDY